MYHIEMQASMVASSTRALLAGTQRSGSLFDASMIYVVSVVSMPCGALEISHSPLLLLYHGYAFGGHRGA